MSLHVEHSPLGSYGYAMYASAATSQLFASYLPSTLGETITVLNLGIISVGTTLLALRQKKVQQDRDERLKDEAAQREYVAEQVLSLHGKLDTATSAASEARARAEAERESLKEQITSLSDAVKIKDQQLVDMVSKLGKPEACPHNAEIQCVQVPTAKDNKKTKPK
jgi:molybdopterin converting factor small subunit